MYGYMGRIAYIDLTNKKIEIEDLDENVAKMYLGGNGVASKIIYEKVPHEITPFSELNYVVFATGPLTNTPMWSSSRGHLGAISPQTNRFADSNFGGNFAVAMKKAGFDVVAIFGKAESPVYVLLDGGKVSIEDAKALWGKNTREAHKNIVEREGKKTESALIGPAGENLVRFGSVICSGSRTSAAGRCGIGAVLGSKNCKGLVAKGNQTIEVWDANGLSQHINPLLPTLMEKARPFSKMGTCVLVEMINKQGKLGTRNYQFETFENAESIGSTTICKEYMEGKTACFRCPIGCGKKVKVTRGFYAGQKVKMPEYESLYAMGSMLENADVVDIFNANAMCDEMGLDTISFGVTLAFLMECIEKGLISKNELEVSISFGGCPQLSDIAMMTANRDGKLGQLISMGSERIAEQIGRGSERYLHSNKGLEIAGHSPRGLRFMSLGYATATRGGSHHDARPCYNPENPSYDPGFQGQAAYCIGSQNNSALGDSLIMCRFAQERLFGMELNENSKGLIPIIECVTGMHFELQELIDIGERIYNLERLINVSRGEARELEKPTYRTSHEPIPDGPCKGFYCPEEEFYKMLDEYYMLRGWDRDGRPKQETIERLKLN